MRKGLVGLFVAAVLAFALASAGPVMADNYAYEATNSEDFGIIDLNTGVYTQIGHMGQLLRGLGVANGVIYGGVDLGNTLYSVNPTSGALTAVGSGSMSYADTGSTLTGLYALDTAGYSGGKANLWSINPLTGAATLIGSTGLTYTGSSAIGLSTNSSTLYFANGAALYTLNTTTGAATLVGFTGTSGLAALVTEGGTLYGAANVPVFLVFTVNPTTGLATFVTTESLAPSTFSGLAPLPTPVPIPGAVLILGPGLAGLAAMRRRFKK